LLQINSGGEKREKIMELLAKKALDALKAFALKDHEGELSEGLGMDAKKAEQAANWTLEQTLMVFEGRLFPLDPETGLSLRAALCEPADAPGSWTPPSCGYEIVYSPILDDCLLLTDTDESVQALKDTGIEWDIIYSMREVKELEDLPPESLRAYHMIKKVFPDSKIKT